MTASTSKKPAETMAAQTDASQTASAGDYMPHATPDETIRPSDTTPPITPTKDETRKAVPAFIMGMLGGLSISAILVLIVLIINPLADVVERLSAVETNLAGAATRRALETNDKRLVAIESRMEGLRGDLDALNRNPITGPVDLNGIKAHLTQIDQALLAWQQDANKAKTPITIPLAQDAARLTMALIITDRLEQGQPISAELQAIEPLLLEQATLASLKPWSDGNPTQAMLVQEFSRLYPALLKAVPVPANEAVHQMLLRHLKQWIHWRRLDQTDTADPESILQRIYLNLQKGLNDDALKLMHALPDTMQSPIKSIERLITQRIEALTAGEKLLNSAMAQLAQSAQTKGGAQ